MSRSKVITKGDSVIATIYLLLVTLDSVIATIYLLLVTLAMTSSSFWRLIKFRGEAI